MTAGKQSHRSTPLLLLHYCFFYHFLYPPAQSLQAKILSYSEYGRNGVYLLSKVLKKETALPRCISQMKCAGIGTVNGFKWFLNCH